jgi:hypothetical protein
MSADSLRFAVAARAVAGGARRLGLRVPNFRSPPRLDGAPRTIRRRADAATVAVVIRGRPLADVVADLIEGVIVANALKGDAAVRGRRRLAACVDAAQRAGAPVASAPRVA